MNSINQYIGSQIYAKRKALGINQEDLAAFLDLSRPQMCNIERGVCGTTNETIYRICCALHCEVSDLFPKVIHHKHKTREVKKVVKVYRTKIVKVKKSTL